MDQTLSPNFQWPSEFKGHTLELLYARGDLRMHRSRVVAIFSSAFKVILLKHLFEKVFLLRSGRKRRTLGATVYIRLLFQPLQFQILRGF